MSNRLPIIEGLDFWQGKQFNFQIIVGEKHQQWLNILTSIS